MELLLSHMMERVAAPNGDEWMRQCLSFFPPPSTSLSSAIPTAHSHTPVSSGFLVPATASYLPGTPPPSVAIDVALAPFLIDGGAVPPMISSQMLRPVSSADTEMTDTAEM